MHNRISVVLMVGLVLVFCAESSAAYAQEKCSMQTMTGTHVFYMKGSSFILDPTQQPYPLHFGGGVAPFANVGLITFRPNGVGDGYYWIFIGTLDGGFDPIPVHVTITEMNEHCTGKYQYQVSLPGIGSATIEERFIAFDDGREFRTIPTTIENGLPTLAWLGTGHRISKSSRPVRFCGQHTAHGTYLMSVENLIAFQPNLAMADTLLVREDISMSGDYTGKMYEKAGPVAVEAEVLGTVTVNPDCSFTNVLKIPAYDVNLVGKGVFFNEGKEFYLLTPGDPNLPPDQQWLKFSFAYGKRIGQ
jgi:hypothetical protein